MPGEERGRDTSRILMMLGWSRWRRIRSSRRIRFACGTCPGHFLDVSGRRRSRSSRRIRFASVAWQNALLIFLIATLPPPAAEWSSGSFAAQTSPSAGWGGERRRLDAWRPDRESSLSARAGAGTHRRRGQGARATRSLRLRPAVRLGRSGSCGAQCQRWW